MLPSIEEAARCPICSEPGSHSSSAAGPNGATIRTYTCMNERCRWFNTGWVVQLNADGSIPERKTGQKDFEKLTPGQEAAARRTLEEIVQEDLRGTNS